MITKELLMDIRSLAKQGYSVRQIARMTGLHRKTVNKYLTRDSLPVYRKINRSGKLDQFQDLIDGWLSSQDYQATKIHDLLTGQGYTGGYDTVRRYVKNIKEQRDRKAYIRFETMPGAQAQVDFGDFQIENADGTKTTVYCFIMILGYSRHMYIEFIDRCIMANFLRCHQRAFGFFGGIPAEILYDNMKNVVIKHIVGVVEWNKTFAEFAVHYGFKPLAAPPYSPWVKGKVERPYNFVRERFWRGYVFNSLLDANRDVARWNTVVAAERIHGTTHEKVSDRFGKERPYLGALPRAPFDLSEKAYRKVHKDCQLSLGGNRYVVPHELVGKTVLLKIKDEILRVFNDDVVAAIYRIPPTKGNTVANPRFYERLKADIAQRQRKYRIPTGKARATRGLTNDSLRYDVMRRPLATYDALIGEVAHV